MGGRESNEKSGGGGLEDHCYKTGYDHATSSALDPDPIGQGIDAFPCTTRESTNKEYARGYVDGLETRDK